jgi:hypothetical protein
MMCSQAMADRSSRSTSDAAMPVSYSVVFDASDCKHRNARLPTSSTMTVVTQCSQRHTHGSPCGPFSQGSLVLRLHITAGPLLLGPHSRLQRRIGGGGALWNYGVDSIGTCGLSMLVQCQWSWMTSGIVATHGDSR